MKYLLILALSLTMSLVGQTKLNGDLNVTAGNLDASSATSTKPIKSGTTLPETCTPNELFNKTDALPGKNIYTCKSSGVWERVGIVRGTKSLTVFDPVLTDSGRVQLSFPIAVKILRVSCSVKAATSVTIQLDERAAATPDTAGVSVLTAGLTCVTTGANTTSFANDGIVERVPVALVVSDVTGTPDTLRVDIEYEEI